MHLGQQIFDYADNFTVKELRELQDLLYIQNTHNELVRNGRNNKE